MSRLTAAVLLVFVACVGVALPGGVSADPVGSDTLVPQKIIPVLSTISNRAVSLTLQNITLTSEYGRFTAPAGKAYLVIGTQWANHIELVSVNGKNTSTAYMVPDLRDHIYLVGDGVSSWQLARELENAPGVLPRKGFTIAKPGEVVTGNLIFEVPRNLQASSVALRFYDFAHGHMFGDLIGTLPPPAAPQFPVSKNEVLEAAVYDVAKTDAIRGVGAPVGLTYLIVNFRARSTVATEADATVFDPHAKPGDKTIVGTVADWKESRKYAQLIVDGEYAWPAVEQTDLPAEPRFLPDLFTGGAMVFLLPEKYASLELRCDFPNARLTTGKIIRPAGLTTLLEGKRPEPVERKSIAGVKDEIFDVAITGQSVADQFGGTRAANGKKFLVLNVTVKNLGKQQEFYQTNDQLKHVDEKGASTAIDKATFTGLRRPIDFIYIPSGEQRTFELAYLVPATETKPRLAYASVTKGGSKVLVLPEIAAIPVASAGAPQLPTIPSGTTQPTAPSARAAIEAHP